MQLTSAAILVAGIAAQQAAATVREGNKDAGRNIG